MLANVLRSVGQIRQRGQQEVSMESTDKRLLTVRETAQRLSVTEWFVYQALAHGRLPGVRVGRAWRINPTDLDQWIKRQTVGG